MDDDESEVELSEGMAVENADGVSLGKLSALLVEEDEEEAEFFLLESSGVERLVPFDAILGVGDGVLVVDVPAGNVQRFPILTGDVAPTAAQMQQAYDVFDEGASDAEDEDGA